MRHPGGFAICSKWRVNNEAGETRKLQFWEHFGEMVSHIVLCGTPEAAHPGRFAIVASSVANTKGMMLFMLLLRDCGARGESSVS